MNMILARLELFLFLAKNRSKKGTSRKSANSK